MLILFLSLNSALVWKLFNNIFQLDFHPRWYWLPLHFRLRSSFGRFSRSTSRRNLRPRSSTGNWLEFHLSFFIEKSLRYTLLNTLCSLWLEFHLTFRNKMDNLIITEEMFILAFELKRSINKMLNLGPLL
jgi:hypothetical protein